MAYQRNDATASAQGITFQFLVALECCFKMKPNEKVYIEKFGDVTIESIFENIQMEVKRRMNNLTDNSKEIWNTFYNWLQDNFEWQQFSSLIYVTIQPCKKESIWYDWNTLDIGMRIEKFQNLLRVKTRGCQTFKNQINEVLQDKATLSDFVSKIHIAYVQNSESYWLNQLATYSKSIPEQNKNVFYHSLLGFIIRKGTFENDGWCITYTEFCNEVEHITLSLVKTSIEFPQLRPDPNIECNREMKFIQKLKEIEIYSEEDFDDASDEYIHAMTYNLRYSTSPHRMQQYEDYRQDLKLIHKNNHRANSRRCKDNVIAQSQTFYDDSRCRPVEPMGNYNRTPPQYRNGVLQILANEDEITWLLKQNNNDNGKYS